MSQLEVEEGLRQGTSNERVAYSMDFAGFGVSTLASASVIAFDEADENDVTATVFPDNTPPTVSVSGAVATLPLLKALTKGHTYRIEVLGVEGTAYYEGYFRVECAK